MTQRNIPEDKKVQQHLETLKSRIDVGFRLPLLRLRHLDYDPSDLNFVFAVCGDQCNNMDPIAG